MTGTFQSAGKPISGKIDKDRARPATSRVAATLNAAPPVQGLLATAQMLGRRGGHETRPAVGSHADQSGNSLAGGVIQARLFRGRTEIEAPEGEADASGIVRTLLGEGTQYVLREDEALTAETVHVLSRERKYLLGEKHDESNWGARSAHWDVDTMVESGKGFPEAPVTVGPEAPTKQNQSLESIHAYLLAALLEWQSALNMWLATWQTWLAPAELSGEDNHLLEQALLASGGDAEPQHDPADDGEAGGPGDGGGGNVGERALPEGQDDPLPADDITDALNFSDVPFASLEKEFGEIDVVVEQYMLLNEHGGSFPNVDQFHARLEELCRPVMETMTAIRAMMELPATTTREAASLRLANVHRAPIQTFVTAVQTLIGETPAGANPARIAEVAGGAPFVHGGNTTESQTLTDPYREAQMIRNIGAARAPLLVKIGNNHIDRVGDAVEGSVKVPLNADFDAMTRKP